MLSKNYIYRSELLFMRFIEEQIDYNQYIEELDEISKAELVGLIYHNEIKSKKDEIFNYEYLHHLSRIENTKQKMIEDKRKQNLSSKEQYYEDDVPKIISEYRKKSTSYRNTHNFFQWIIIIGSVIVTSTTGATVVADTFSFSIWFKWIAAIISILVSISAGATGYYKFRERSANLQEAADDIEQEREALRLEIEYYRGKSKEEALADFAEKVRKRIKEQQKREQILEQPSDNKQGQIHATGLHNI